MTEEVQGWVTHPELPGSYPLRMSDHDPWFLVLGDIDEGAERALHRGNLLTLGPSPDEGDRRPIVGVAVVGTFLAKSYELLAPRRVTLASGKTKYVKLRALGGDSAYPLRPGSTIIGGRNSGFFDRDGVILSAEYIGGAPERFEDWVYLVASADGGTANWVPLDDINITVSGPDRVVALRESLGVTEDDRRIVDFLMRTGERELLNFLSISSDTIRNLNPRQFEETVTSIYRNLGFSVEPMGRWNEQDGGVDLIAISKSPSNAEVRTAIQCKASRNKISARPMRELAGVMPRFGTRQGVVVTTSSFTTPARNERDSWFMNIELADRASLYDKILQIMGAWVVDTTADDGPVIEFGLS